MDDLFASDVRTDFIVIQSSTLASGFSGIVRRRRDESAFAARGLDFLASKVSNEQAPAPRFGRRDDLEGNEFFLRSASNLSLGRDRRGALSFQHISYTLHVFVGCGVDRFDFTRVFALRFDRDVFRHTVDRVGVDRRRTIGENLGIFDRHRFNASRDHKGQNRRGVFMLSRILDILVRFSRVFVLDRRTSLVEFDFIIIGIGRFLLVRRVDRRVRFAHHCARCFH